MDDKNIINFDFNSDKVFKLSLKDILIILGAKINNETNKMEFDLNDKILEVFPKVCEFDCFDNNLYEEYITKISIINNESISIKTGNELDNIDKWLELGLIPGSQVKIGDKKWMLEYITIENGEVIVSAREFNIEKFQNKTAEVLKLYFNVLKELINNGTCQIV